MRVKVFMMPYIMACDVLAHKKHVIKIYEIVSHPLLEDCTEFCILHFAPWCIYEYLISFNGNGFMIDDECVGKNSTIGTCKFHRFKQYFNGKKRCIDLGLHIGRE